MNFISFKNLSKKLGDRSRSSIHRDMKTKGFPKPLSFGGSVVWDEASVDRWLQELSEVPYIPKPVAVPKPGNRRGRKPKNAGVDNEK